MNPQPLESESRVFLAKGTNDVWCEQVIADDDTLTDMLDGRKSVEASDFTLIEDRDAFVVFEEDVEEAVRYVKVRRGAKDALFLVTLAQDGGGNGGSTAGTAPTWTYTVKDYETSATLKKNAAGDNATAMSPISGTRLPSQASAATVGTAIRKDDGTLVLVQAFEAYTNGSC
jgi:hypothetical protein